MFIIMLMVNMLNSVWFPFTRATCSSLGVIVPDLFESTLSKNNLSLSAPGMLGGGGAGLLGLNPDMVAGGLGDVWQGNNRLAPQC